MQNYHSKEKNVLSNRIKKKTISIAKKLNRFYPDFKPKIRHNPLDELILTILSQATNDRNSLKAFGQLKKQFKGWEDLIQAPLSDIEDTIRIGGLAPTKSRRIKELLVEIARRNKASGQLKNGSPYHLDFLKKMGFEEARRFLTSFKGVGEKTAACVLVFSLQKPAFPIDTHIHRILVRQGIIPKKMPVEKAHGFMLELIEPEERYRFHVNLITYGREVCHARNPECSVCVIRRTCCYVR